MANVTGRYIPTLSQAMEGKKSVSVDDLQEEFRKAWEAIHYLNGRLGAVTIRDSLTVEGALTSESLEAQGQLTFGDFLTVNERPMDPGGATAPDVSVAGSSRIYYDRILDKLQVSENAGAYVDLVGGSAATPAYGIWRKTASTAGAGSFDWDTEDENTGEFTRQVANTQIAVNFTGTICVLANLGSASAGAWEGHVFKNATLMARKYVNSNGDSYSEAPIVWVGSVVPGDFVELVGASATNRYGDAAKYTRLYIFRIN